MDATRSSRSIAPWFLLIGVVVLGIAVATQDGIAEVGGLVVMLAVVAVALGLVPFALGLLLQVGLRDKHAHAAVPWILGLVVGVFTLVASHFIPRLPTRNLGDALFQMLAFGAFMSAGIQSVLAFRQGRADRTEAALPEA